MGKELFKISGQYGVYLGLFLCAFTIFMWLTGLDTTYYEVGKTVELFVSAVPVVAILYAIYRLNRRTKLTVFKRLIAGLTVGIVSITVSAPFIEIYHLYINPEWFDAVLRVQERQMLDSGANPEEIISRLERMEANNTTINSVLGAFAFGGILFPAVVSFLSLIIIRNKKKDVPV